MAGFQATSSYPTRLAGETVLTASGGTTIDVTGLDGDRDQDWIWEAGIINNSGVSGIDLEWRFNASGSNHRAAGLHNATLTTFTTTAMYIASGPAASQRITVGGQVRAKSGAIRTVRSVGVQYNAVSASVLTWNILGEWTDTSTNVTSIRLVANSGGNFASGSYLRLWRLW